MQLNVFVLSRPYGVYSYEFDIDYPIGSLIIVPFGNKTALGIVWGKESLYKDEIKKYISFSGFILKENYIKILKDTAFDTFGELHKILKLALPKYVMQNLKKNDFYLIKEHDKFLKPHEVMSYIDMKKYANMSIASINKKLNNNDLVKLGNIEIIKFKKDNRPSNKNRNPLFSSINLSEIQSDALVDIENNITIKPTILQGITGSGKTEVYFKLMEKIINSDDQVLILLPEIQLANQVYNRLMKNFPNSNTKLFHSEISEKNRMILWNDAINNDVQIVVGTRSAVFLPFDNLQLIIMDEEHDSSSYKQEQGTQYDTRDVIRSRNKHDKCKVLLSSATPSIESMVNAKSGNYKLVKMQSRYHGQRLPNIKIVEMKKKKWISEEVEKAILETVQKKEQILLFINKKGYAPILFCTNCKYKLECKKCTSNMTFYKSDNRIQCTHCNHREIFDKCFYCNSDKIVPCGPGTERLIEEVKKITDAATMEITSDSKDISGKLKKIVDNEVQVIVATQILAKGHTFPKLSTVCIIDGDSGMYSIDTSSTEKMYQLVTQVIGRAGRVDIAGNVYIQTYFPNSDFIKSITGNFDDFIENEISKRKESHMPPFVNILSITVSHKNESSLKEYCYSLYENFSDFIQKLKLMGPAKARVYKINNIYRMCFLIKYNDIAKDKIIHWLKSNKLFSKMTIKMQVNPQSIL